MKRSSKHIDDREIKELFAAYERNEITINDILFNLSGYIYSFPRITQRLDEDSASDFFVYAIERLPKKLTQYKIKEVTFEAWFNVVLTRLYYDWIKKGKSPLKIEIAPDMEKYVAESSPFDPDKLLWKERYLGKIYDLLNTLPPKIQIIMKLHYFDFFSGDDIYLIYEIYDQEISFLWITMMCLSINP